MAGRRNKYDMVHDLLYNSTQPQPMSDLFRMAEMDHRVARRYIEKCQILGLIENKIDGLFQTTELGREYVWAYEVGYRDHAEKILEKF